MSSFLSVSWDLKFLWLKPARQGRLVTMAMMAPLGRVHSLVNRRNSASDTAVMADKELATDSKTLVLRFYIQFILRY